MNTLVPSIEVSNIPDLLHVVKAVRASKKPRMLKVHGETLAMVVPVGTRQKAPVSDLWAHYDPKLVKQALQRSTKTLAGVDKNQLLTDITQQREQE